MKKISLFFFVRLLLILFVSLIGKIYIPYRGFFPYQEIEALSKLPTFISAFANFDGVHYIKIAMYGYQQYDQAFFPLYPLLIHIISIFVGFRYLLVGLLISNSCFFIGLVYLYKLCRLMMKEEKFWWVLCFIFIFPTAFFFSAVYTEGLFFMLFMGVLYYLHTGRFKLLVLFAILSSLTKFIGVFLVIPIFFYFWFEKRQLSLKNILILFSPIFGLAIYCLYLLKTTGDPFFFFTSQKVFANRSTHIILLPQVYFRYFKIFLTNQFSTAFFVAAVEMLLFSLVFIACCIEFIFSYKKRNYFFLSLSIFSLLSIVLPTLTGTFSSIPRYALFAPSVFFFLAKIESKKIKIISVFVMGTLQVILLMLFIQGYFVS